MKEKIRKIWEITLKNGKYVFPAVVCFAVAITVAIALKAGGVHRDELEKIGETIGTSESQTVVPSSETTEEIPLVKNEDPAVQAAIEKYYTALAEGDEEALNAVCDKVEEMDMLWFLETAKYVEYYPALDVYVKPGYADGETIAYVCFQVKLTGKEDAYPGYMRHYLCTGEDGSVYIKRTGLSNEANAYVLKVSGEADVLELTNRIKVEFDELMEQKPDLLGYMNDISEEVMRMVGIELGNQKGEATTETNPDGQEGGEGAEGREPDENGDQTTQSQEAEIVYAIASTTVNVRKSDSEKAEKIGRVTGGTKVQVLEQLVNGWSKIIYENNKEGFIMSKFLKVQESVTKYEPIGKVKALDNINVRADASTDSTKIGTLVKDDSVDLLAEEGEWCKVNFKGQIAYVKAEYVEKTE